MIVTGFPVPPGPVRQALTALRIVRSGDADAIAALGDVHDLPRPWDPDSCPPELRQHLWRWCDQVAAWVNHEYAWRPAAVIPACWPRHPHLAQELPVLACLRLAAGEALNPDPVEEWHRYTLPLFLDRTAARLGEATCRTGRHADWPAANRHDAFTTTTAVTERGELFRADTAAGGHLRPATSTGA